MIDSTYVCTSFGAVLNAYFRYSIFIFIDFLFISIMYILNMLCHYKDAL